MARPRAPRRTYPPSVWACLNVNQCEERESATLGRSGVTRVIFDAMRGAPEPQTIRQIATSLAAAKGAPDDAQRFMSRTERILYRLRLRGVVECVDIGGRAKGWRIVSP